MSELARITARYFAVLLEREGLSASIPDMRAEVAAAGEVDERAHAAAAEAAINAWHATDQAKDPASASAAYQRKIDGLVDGARDETARGRQARRQP